MITSGADPIRPRSCDVEKSRWQFWDRLNRAIHLYTGLFLVPWMIVYAISAVLLNHTALFVEKYHSPQKWETEREVDFTPGSSVSSDDELARAVLASVQLDGPYRVAAAPDATQLTLLRYNVGGQYRVTYQRSKNHVVVDRLKPTNWFSFINNLHFVMGYGQSSWITFTWAVIVDSVAISTLLWVITGIYIWARRPRKLIAGICLGAGCLIFAVLVVLLCR